MDHRTTARNLEEEDRYSCPPSDVVTNENPEHLRNLGPDPDVRLQCTMVVTAPQRKQRHVRYDSE